VVPPQSGGGGVPERVAPMTREQLLVTIAVMAGLAVAALDTTVVATAMPTIIGQLGGVQRYGWVFSGYLLAATTTVPMFSKLADMYGRKPIFLIGISMFVGGSVLCGLSQSIGQLIIFRTLQGLGAGAVQPMALTIVGDLFEPVKRARIQGLFSSVWGVSALVGPALGGVLTATVGWRWVFYVNVPVGAVAMWLLIRHFHERIERRSHRLDWAGTLSLSAGIALLLIAVTEVGTTAGWSSPAVLGLLALAVALLVAFINIEQRAAEPVIDLDLVRRPLLSVTLALQILAGVLLFGVQSYVPPMVQGVQGGSAVAAGAAVATMSIGWPLASIVTGRWLVRSTSRPPILLGTACLLAGSLLLTQIARVDWLPYAMLASAVVGSGLGFLNTAIIVTLQSSVQWQQRGVVTGLVQFSRTIGGAVGVGLLGGILSAVVGPRASEILDPLRRADVPSREFEALAASLTTGLVGIYLVLVAVALVAVVVAWRRAPAIDVTASSAGHSAEPPS
jgi:EmrB/QacA subfamily drug resistance transporter